MRLKTSHIYLVFSLVILVVIFWFFSAKPGSENGLPHVRNDVTPRSRKQQDGSFFRRRETVSKAKMMPGIRPNEKGSFGEIVPDPPILNESKRVTTSAIEKYGLTEDDADLLQKSFDEFIANAESIMAARAVYDEYHSDPENYVWEYNIRALPDRGASLLNEFRKNMIGLLGDEKGSELFNDFSKTRNEASMLGGFGAYDVHIVFHPNSNGSAQIVSFDYLSPESGSRVQSAQMILSEFVKIYGDVFDLSAMKEIPKNETFENESE
jgi:hypothetical protein